MNLTEKTVLKLGGSVLSSRENIAAVPKLVRRYKNPVVVVSALAGITARLTAFVIGIGEDKSIDGVEKFVNRLGKIHLELAGGTIRELSRKQTLQRELDFELSRLKNLLQGVAFLGEVPDSVLARVLAFGERFSALAVSHVLSGAGIASRMVTSEEMGLTTDDNDLNATVNLAQSRQLVKKALSGTFTAVVPGFYGVSGKGRVTLLGKGGSDYSAAAIACCINAPSLDIFKDVTGYLSADPAFVADVRPIPRLSYREAAELSYFGARILHPRTMEPLYGQGIPIRLFPFPSHDGSTPSTVIHRKSQVDEAVVKSVTFSDDFSIVEVRGDGVGLVPGLLASVAKSVGRAGLNIKSVITAQTAINLLLESEDAKKAAAAVENLDLHAVESVRIRESVGVVAVVGEGIRTRPGIAARMFSALATAGINVRMIAFGASPVAAYFVVDRKDRALSVTSIHKAFFSRAVAT
ncbi:MAG: aspartate kinase [Acidobacteria bacterium]|nr:aspartate kinase [Acidobacteriota bacterium]